MFLKLKQNNFKALLALYDAVNHFHSIVSSISNDFD